MPQQQLLLPGSHTQIQVVGMAFIRMTATRSCVSLLYLHPLLETLVLISCTPVVPRAYRIED